MTPSGIRLASVTQYTTVVVGNLGSSCCYNAAQIITADVQPAGSSLLCQRFVAQTVTSFLKLAHHNTNYAMILPLMRFQLRMAAQILPQLCLRVV
jgi:hypothetical protein